MPSTRPLPRPSTRSLRRLALGLGLAFGLGATAAAQTTMRINISTAQNSHQGVAIDTFAKEVEKRTGGRYKVQTFYNAALGAERESVEAVQLGTHELTFSSSGPIPNFVPETKILDVPFLFRDKAHARAVLDGPIGQELLTRFDGKGFKALAWAENGFRHMSNSKRAVKEPGDLKGLKMRTMENPVHIAAYKGFGIVTTPMAFSEVFTALQQGTVDGQENPLSVIISAKFDQVQKHLTLTGHVYSPALFLMNKALFDKLPAADQQAFIDAARQGAKLNRARVDEDDAKGVADLRAKGMTVIENIDKARFVAALAPVNAQFEKQFGKAALEQIRSAQ
ncbi:DctP family TRAP transporter solute-binding subunit [Verminephrobacter eiseniae]|uniref:TRAP transporter substrate-binding protein n=1 Tax=Verminephrobacter eiseniae TaxID=364317 RepID=UPI0022371D4A|nr:TRAP transporter substrate-binding protein [Verminephrobacter eiseniae]MCW5231747.1 DctP family TRAP transporter solute-binding subunit [Verminephrobacter eiseniae]